MSSLPFSSVVCRWLLVSLSSFPWWRLTNQQSIIVFTGFISSSTFVKESLTTKKHPIHTFEINIKIHNGLHDNKERVINFVLSWASPLSCFCVEKEKVIINKNFLRRSLKRSYSYYPLYYSSHGLPLYSIILKGTILPIFT